MVLGWFAVFLYERSDELFRSRHVEIVMPDRRPGAAQVAYTSRPCVRSIEIESDDRVGQSKFCVLLDQIGNLVAGEFPADDVGLCLSDLQQIGAEIGYVGGDQFIA